MTNLDRIRAMSAEELAVFLNDLAFRAVPCKYVCKYMAGTAECKEQDKTCNGAIKQWLESEVKE